MRLVNRMNGLDVSLQMDLLHEIAGTSVALIRSGFAVGFGVSRMSRVRMLLLYGAADRPQMRLIGGFKAAASHVA